MSKHILQFDIERDGHMAQYMVRPGCGEHRKFEILDAKSAERTVCAECRCKLTCKGSKEDAGRQSGGKEGRKKGRPERAVLT